MFYSYSKKRPRLQTSSLLNSRELWTSSCQHKSPLASEASVRALPLALHVTAPGLPKASVGRRIRQAKRHRHSRSYRHSSELSRAPRRSLLLLWIDEAVNESACEQQISHQLNPDFVIVSCKWLVIFKVLCKCFISSTFKRCCMCAKYR